MSFNSKPISMKMPALVKVSTKGLAVPHGTHTVSMKVKPQHSAKVNYGKTSTLKQKGSSQL